MHAYRIIYIICTNVIRHQLNSISLISHTGNCARQENYSTLDQANTIYTISIFCPVVTMFLTYTILEILTDFVADMTISKVTAYIQ